MRVANGFVLLTGLLAACATLPATQDTPFLPPGVFGVYLDNDVGAINYSSWAFASPANTRGSPVGAARAIIALEYLAGELKENPRWIKIDAAIPIHLDRAREDIRGFLGIRPDATPQLVVNALLALSFALQTGNQPAATQILSAPLFTQPPAQTLQRLSNLPYVQEANLATLRADSEMLADGGSQS